LEKRKESEIKRKNYSALDIAKFICALLIIMAHFISEWCKGKIPVIVDYAFSLYIIAVPFFFACSSFLFFKKLNALETVEKKDAYFLAYQKRLWLMYGLWTLVYFPTVMFTWISKGTFSWEQILKYLHMAVTLQTYATIWFLPALAVGIAILYLLIEKCKISRTWLIVISLCLYIIGAFGYSYNFLWKGTWVGNFYDLYILIFKTTRNGLFNGVPLLFIGYLLAEENIETSSRNFWINIIIAISFLILLVGEAFFLKIVFNVTGMDFIFSLVPFIYFFVRALLSLDIENKPIFLWCRKLSLLMFTSQRIFLSVLPTFLPSVFKVLYSNPYIGLILVVILTVAFSFGFSLLSEKVKFLKWMV
jgi:serine/alanine racemase